MNIKSKKVVKTIKIRVSNNNTFTGKYFTGDKHPGLDPDFRFYEVEYDDKYDSGNESVINIKIDKSLTTTKKNTKNITSPVIKYFYHQGPKVIHMLRDMTVSVFEHFGITTWKGIYQRWVFI